MFLWLVKEMNILTELKRYLSDIDNTEMKKRLCDLYKNSDVVEKMINVFLLGSRYK